MYDDEKKTESVREMNNDGIIQAIGLTFIGARNKKLV
jgi:hypothetical protein